MNTTKTPEEAVACAISGAELDSVYTKRYLRDFQCDEIAQAAINAFLSTLPKDGPTDEEIEKCVVCNDSVPAYVHVRYQKTLRALFVPYIAKAQEKSNGTEYKRLLHESETDCAKLIAKCEALAAELAAKGSELARLYSGNSERLISDLAETQKRSQDNYDNMLIAQKKLTEAIARSEKAEAEQDRLMLRSVAAMAVAEEDDYSPIPIDCPMLVAVAALRKDRDSLRQQLELTKGISDGFSTALMKAEKDLRILAGAAENMLNEFAWMDGPEGWGEACQKLRSSFLPAPSPDAVEEKKCPECGGDGLNSGSFSAEEGDEPPCSHCKGTGHSPDAGKMVEPAPVECRERVEIGVRTVSGTVDFAKPSEAPTPRTDKEQFNQYPLTPGAPVLVVRARFARQLERELAEAKARVEGLITLLHQAELSLSHAMKRDHDFTGCCDGCKHGMTTLAKIKEAVK